MVGSVCVMWTLKIIMTTTPTTAGSFHKPVFRPLAQPPADHGQIVIGLDSGRSLGILGFEGSFYTRTSDGIYHFLSAGRMLAAQGWHYNQTDVHMRFDHWVSHDGHHWNHSAKLYESSGIFDGTDRRGSTWAPMAAFDRVTDRWHLFYIAYRASPDYQIPLGLYDNTAAHFYVAWDGMAYHAMSSVPGEGGIGGPYEDVGPAMDQESYGGFDAGKDAWEGDMGVSMFFPFQLDDGTWLATYGSEFGRFPHYCNPVCRQIGLARWQGSGGLGADGHFSRLHEFGPLDAGFRPASPGIENPVVVKITNGSTYVAVYHVYVPGAMGVSYSNDGLHWTRQEGDLIIGMGGQGETYCSSDVTTVNGLVPEPSQGAGVYSVMYTAGGGGDGGGGGAICRGYIANVAEAEAGILPIILV